MSVNTIFDDEPEVIEQPSLTPTIAAQAVARSDALALTEGWMTSKEAFIQEWEDEYRRDPLSTFRLGFCRHCDVSLGDTEDDKVMDLIPGKSWLPNVCCVGCADAGKARLAIEARDQQSARFAGIVPTDFINWKPEMGNNVALARAKDAFKPEEKKGIVLHGTSGSCKTRILWQLVRGLLELPEARSWLVLDAAQIADEGIPKEAHKVEFLFIDDLGNETQNRKFETALLRLLRTRNDWHRPTTITTQMTGAMFKQRYFSGTAAEATLRRLRDRCEFVTTDGKHAAAA